MIRYSRGPRPASSLSRAEDASVQLTDNPEESSYRSFISGLPYKDQVAQMRPPGPIMLSRARSETPAAPATDVLSVVQQAREHSGTALPAPLQAQLEHSLGSDLSAVRLHNGPSAQTAASALGARAYTIGQDIHFAQGQYSPGSSSGNELIAHEVAHTVQQKGGAAKTANGRITSSPGDATENAAGQFATHFVSGSATPAPSIAAGSAPHQISGWWADGHRAITAAAGGRAENFREMPKTVGYVALNAGGLDTTWQSAIENFATYLGDSGKAQKSFEEMLKRWNTLSKEQKEKLQFDWDNLSFHWRLPDERPLHGEAGGYVSEAGEGINQSAVLGMLNEAVELAKSGDSRECLVKLADACHAAEDRGSHGEGRPFTGHDPRINYVLKPDGTKNEHYTPGWDCDDPSKNSGGRVLAEGYALEVFNQFAALINQEEDADKIWTKLGGNAQYSKNRPVNQKGRSRMEAMDRWAKKSTKSRDWGSLQETNEGYNEMVEEVGHGEVVSNPEQNMKHFYEGGHMMADLVNRLETLKTKVTEGDLKESEHTYHLHSNLAKAATSFLYWVESDTRLSQESKETIKSACQSLIDFYTEMAQVIQDKDVYTALRKKYNLSMMKGKRNQQVRDKILEITGGHIEKLSGLHGSWADMTGGTGPVQVNTTGFQIPNRINDVNDLIQALVECEYDPEMTEKVIEVYNSSKEGMDPEQRKAPDLVYLRSDVLYREINAGKHAMHELDTKLGLLTDLDSALEEYNSAYKNELKAFQTTVQSWMTNRDRVIELPEYVRMEMVKTLREQMKLLKAKLG